MKDIVNPHMREALERLERAVGRADAAAAAIAGAVGQSKAAGDDARARAHALAADLERLARDHAALKQTAGSVAERLDGVIGQISRVTQN